MTNTLRASLSFFILITLLLFSKSDSSAQSCYLTVDMMMDGSLFRKSAQVVYKEGGSELRLETMRLGESYSLKVHFIQSTTESRAVHMTVDGHKHPLELKLYGGGVLKLVPEKDEIVRSSTERGEISYLNTYQLSKGQLRSMALMSITDVILNCFGTELKSGGKNDDIELKISALSAEKFASDMACLIRDSDEDKKVDSSSFEQTSKLIEKRSETLEIKKGQVDEAPAKKASTSVETGSQTDVLLTEIRDLLKEGAANEKKEFVPRVFGFGVYFKTNYLFSSILTAGTDIDVAINKFMSGASINVSFNAGMRKKVGFRFEPYVDFLVTNTENQFGSSNIKSEIGLVDTGLRLLLMIRRGRVNIYPGVSASYINISGKQSISSSSTKLATRNGASVGVILGGEYLITPHIGVRIESGAMYFGLGKISSNSQSYSNQAQNAFGSFARLGGSFYF